MGLGTGTRGLVRVVAPGVVPARTERGRRAQLAVSVPEVGMREAWLLRAVLTRTLPTDDEVIEDVRLARLEGSAALVRRLARARLRRFSALLAPAPRLVADAIMVDVHETATTRLNTGVQRVARAVAERWSRDHGALLVGWSVTRGRIRVIRPTAFGRRARRGLLERRAIVPVGGTLLVPEIIVDRERNVRLRALAGRSGVRCVLLGHDCIPLTQAETAGVGMPGAFAKYLAAASAFAMIATVSRSSMSDFEGWRSMLAAAGMRGPELTTVPLPVEAGTLDSRDEATARGMLLLDDSGEALPMVLCVGSHEPRKNHAAVMEAAELLWRKGMRFSLVFVGGNSWNADEFLAQLARARAAGRPVTVASSLPDGLLWWAYRLARVSVFPSLTEGFGLPVAESLACGTPVVTSGYGSMAEVAADGGCLLIDPRDARSIASALATVLDDEDVHTRLQEESRKRDRRGWDDYAEELWAAVMA